MKMGFFGDLLFIPRCADLSDFLAACGGEEGKMSGGTPHPGKGLRPLHLKFSDLGLYPLHLYKEYDADYKSI
jgi:hypothetical protein